ncbi:hypothetical protein GCM10009807_04940 [Microbacterium lacus]|uniref:Uncharacterized protein n=1 Tax=Microbacterium lacus TaxID=415217 RepID=A0ABN2G1N6_9MICO
MPASLESATGVRPRPRTVSSPARVKRRGDIDTQGVLGARTVRFLPAVARGQRQRLATRPRRWRNAYPARTVKFTMEENT